MGFKISGIILFLLAVFLLYKTLKKSQTRDKRYKKGYKTKCGFKIFLNIIISIVLFYGAFKLITF